MARGHLTQSSKQSAMNTVVHNEYVILTVGVSMFRCLSSVTTFSLIS